MLSEPSLRLSLFVSRALGDSCCPANVEFQLRGVLARPWLTGQWCGRGARNSEEDCTARFSPGPCQGSPSAANAS